MRKNKVFIFLLAFASLMSAGAVCARAQMPQEGQVIEFLEFREVDIKDILRQLAKQYGLNIVFSETVRGLVTVQLANVSIEQALDSIITVNGFSYTKKGNVYKVTTQDEAIREGRQTKLFKLNNADAVKLKETLSKVLTTEGSIEADSRSNSILVTDAQVVINKIDEMIPVLDEITPQVLIETRLIETSLMNTENLGVEWNTLVSAGGSSRKTTLPFQPQGGESYADNIYTSAMGNYSSDGNFSSAYAFPKVDTSNFVFGTLDFTTLTAALKFLKERTNTRLLANPRIVTLNNQKATINVGKVIPIATYERDANTGEWGITGWEDQNVGISLEVTPQISPTGHIKLKLKPEVSSEAGSIGTGENYRPVISTRTAETEVQIRDGQTVVIAGLVKTKDSTTVTKIPILGDIPIVGKLFRRTDVGTATEPKEQTDLMIFVTAKIIKDSSEPLIAWESGMITSPPRTFKLETREIK